MRVTHDDGVEMTFDNIVNDSSPYGSDVLNRIGIFFSESECSSFEVRAALIFQFSGSGLPGHISGYAHDENNMTN